MPCAQQCSLAPVVSCLQSVQVQCPTWRIARFHVNRNAMRIGVQCACPMLCGITSKSWFNRCRNMAVTAPLVCEQCVQHACHCSTAGRQVSTYVRADTHVEPHHRCRVLPKSNTTKHLHVARNWFAPTTQKVQDPLFLGNAKCNNNQVVTEKEETLPSATGH